MFFGREDVIAKLAALMGKSTSSLVTCRGRRRIGKSTLVEEFARKYGARFVKIEGLRPSPRTTNQDEIDNFLDQLALYGGKRTGRIESWLEAFRELDKLIGEDFTVVLLDEISWMGYFDKLFSDRLKIAWDNMWKKHPKLILVLCGSVSSWIKDNIIDNEAFVGRRSCDLVVHELPLKECVKFWGNKIERTDPREIIDILSITGGVPRYLEEVNPSLSAAENIKRMCFSRDGILRTDFDQMFNDVITAQPDFTATVLRCLVGGAKSAAEITKELKLPKGGRVSAALIRLEEAGLVSSDAGKNPETGEELRELRYRLSDNYARFYLYYIEPLKDIIDRDGYEFTALDTLENIDVFMGLAFENLVVNNFRELIAPLHLSGALLTSASPYSRRGSSKSRGRKGCQIDLLLQTRKALYIVEAKRKREIKRSVIDEVDDKVRAIKRRPGLSIKTALVYEGQLSPLVQADGYFDAIISFSHLIGL